MMSTWVQALQMHASKASLFGDLLCDHVQQQLKNYASVNGKSCNCMQDTNMLHVHNAASTCE